MTIAMVVALSFLMTIAKGFPLLFAIATIKSEKVHQRWKSDNIMISKRVKRRYKKLAFFEYKKNNSAPRNIFLFGCTNNIFANCTFSCWSVTYRKFTCWYIFKTQIWFGFNQYLFIDSQRLFYSRKLVLNLSMKAF